MQMNDSRIVSIDCIQGSTRSIPVSSEGFPNCREVCPVSVGKSQGYPPQTLTLRLEVASRQMMKMCSVPIAILASKRKQAEGVPPVSSEFGGYGLIYDGGSKLMPVHMIFAALGSLSLWYRPKM